MPGSGPSWPTGALSTALHATTAPATARRSATQMPIVKPSWRRTLHRTSRSSTKLHSAEILTSTSTGALVKPLDAVLDRCSTSPSTRSSAAFTPQQAVTEPQLRPLPAGFVLVCSTWTHRHHARPQDPARHRPVLLGLTTRSSRPAGGAGSLISHPTALRWGYHGVQVPRAVHS